MSKSIDIGKEAKAMDEKRFSERIKLKRSSLFKIMIAVILYFVMMLLFYIFL
jgi:hypothetical protein